ncbi:hypothetical protein M3Y99_00880600 [Aphelenchoides fujianensis]|nr:hypothetical protein M3Y99_00880600 [Aphelenchoides fujianensis]
MLEIIRGLKAKHENAEPEPENIKWLPPSRRRHFRDTEEWRQKRSRIISKIRCMGRINLALILHRLPLLFAVLN